MGLSRDFSEMVTGAEISLSFLPLVSLADGAGCQLGSQLGPQAATSTPSPAFLAARCLGSETEKPERTRRSCIGFHDLALEVTWQHLSSEASGILGRESRLHEKGEGHWQGHIIRSECEMEDSVLAVLENLICHTLPNK